MTIIEGEVETTALAKPRARVPAASSPNPISIVQTAIEKGITGADLKEIMDLQERWEANQARKAFDIALANAQAEMPTVIKNKHVYFEPKNGGKATEYWHEDHAAVVESIKPILHKHGLGQRHKIKQTLVNGSMLITVTCIITGHGWREEVELSSGPDDNGSGMNAIQRIKSATTYLKRTTLETALGLAAKEDDDGRGTTAQPSDITALQLEELRALIIEVDAKEANICKACHVDRLELMTQKTYQQAKAKLETMRAPL
ncbi:ERF family protein [Bradyrhizobium sp. SZCCHNRI1002]|uniref:ERF family protein n=1 Tax=Bradyrhizobium sp. SZCCHNRI1002 TaxID=3057274 RepID=UPI0028EE4438|nr:ERF family protein [Bradyrhizobium sp. SZCCHNRI1002]